ncbi:MAG: protein-L-isoaspartate(D-aspartate) O-methyltransferase [Dehalococcoidia bacterium]
MHGLDASRSQLLQHLSREINDERVIEAISRVPRELFVPPSAYSYAYDDRPLSIGYQQTISQPFIVALMTEAMNIQKNDRVLELGTGSGYQTAILAELAAKVISTERVPQLIDSATSVLARLGYTNIEIHLAGETLGWPQGAPYNAIIVTAGAPDIPEVLIDQLAPAGRLVIPVGSRWEQELLRITKTDSGNRIDKLGGCRFVPLIGTNAWDKD